MRENKEIGIWQHFLQLIVVTLLFGASQVSAQTAEENQQINPESISVVIRKSPTDVPLLPKRGKSMLLDYEATRVLPKKIDVETHPAFALPTEPYTPYYTDPTPIHLGDYSTAGLIPLTRRSALIGSGDQTTMPGLGRVNEATIGYVHALSDRLFMQIGLRADKFQIGTNISEAFSTSGSLYYQATDKIGFRAFGTYNLSNSLYSQVNSYGATMSYQFSDRFTMEAGAQRVYQPMRGGWETVPVVIPQYKVNEKVTLGFDVGGLIYEIIRSATYNRENFQMGPTIGPPPKPSLRPR